MIVKMVFKTALTTCSRECNNPVPEDDEEGSEGMYWNVAYCPYTAEALFAAQMQNNDHRMASLKSKLVVTIDSPFLAQYKWTGWSVERTPSFCGVRVQSLTSAVTVEKGAV